MEQPTLCAGRLTHPSPARAQVPQALRATICSTRHQGRRANSAIASNMRDSVGLLRSPQTLMPACFEAATHAP